MTLFKNINYKFYPLFNHGIYGLFFFKQSQRTFVSTKISLFSSEDQDSSKPSAIEETFSEMSKTQMLPMSGIQSTTPADSKAVPKVEDQVPNISSADADTPKVSVPKSSPIDDDSDNSLSDISKNNFILKLDSLHKLIESKFDSKDYSSYSKLNNQSNDSKDDGKYLNDRVVFIDSSDSSSSVPVTFDLDFILYSKDVQLEINNLFNFYILKHNSYIIPDLELSHIKSSSNRLTLIKLSEHLPFKLDIWKNIYKFYFKSIFNIVSKLNPLSIKHLRGLNYKLTSNDSLKPTPALNLTFNLDSSVSKIAYGYANGLHELALFLNSKFSKIDIDYNFNSSVPRTHEITVNWYYINSENKEIKISKTHRSTDLSFETSLIVDSYDFKESESIYYSKSYKNILSDLFSLDTADVVAETFQTSSFTKHVITSNKGSGSIVEWSDGVSSRMMTNGPISYDFSNYYIFNTFISLLKIDNLLDLENNSDNDIVNDFLIYLAAMIKHYIISKTSPSGMILKVLNSKFTISSVSKVMSDTDLHNKYKLYVKSGDIYPSTPVQFDFYFFRDTIKRFSSFIIISAFSNISINRPMKSFISINDKLSKHNFSLYARDRSLLFANSYISDSSFDFQKSIYFITFDELVIEMYIKSMILTKVPDYIPLITRGQWKGSGVNSNLIYSSYLNNVLVKYSFTKEYQDILNFILNIICSSKEYNLGNSFKRKTRLVSVCPDVFERFVFESDTPIEVSSTNLGVTDEDYLSDSD